MQRFAALFVALVCLFSYPHHVQTSAQQNAIQIQGIKERITIRRDERGIPYVEAQNDEDLYFGQGYATAQDRLWQMDLFRRTARGELAEVFGISLSTLPLDQDKLHRTYGFAQAAEAEVAAASPRTRDDARSLRTRRERVRCFPRSKVDAAGVSDPAIQLSTVDTG